MPTPPSLIEQTIPLPAIGTPEPAPATPGGPDSIHVQVDPRRETIAGGGLPWYPARVRALPAWIDDVSRDFPGAYDSMLLDSQVASTINLRRLSVLAQGWGLDVPPGTEDVPLAETIRTALAGWLRALRTPLPRVLFELLGALIYGWAPAEQVLDYDAAGRLALVDIKPKACADVVLFVDAFGNEIGYRPVLPGMPLPWGMPWDPSLRGADGALVQIYDRRKLIVHKYQPNARHLLGQSALRAAWKDWWFKEQLEPEYLKYIVQFASPIAYGKTDTAAKPYRARDAAGNPIPNGPLIYPADALGAALQTLHNGGYVVTEGEKSDIKFLYVQGDGRPFLAAYDLKDRAITKVVLHETLATEEGEHQARAASETHKDILDLVFNTDKGDLEGTLTRDCLYPLVVYNWGQAAADLYTPQFVLPRIEHQDVNATRAGIAALEKAGFLHRSQYPGLDSQADLPARDQAQAEADYERALAAQAAAVAAQATTQSDRAAGGRVANETQDEGAAA